MSGLCHRVLWKPRGSYFLSHFLAVKTRQITQCAASMDVWFVHKPVRVRPVVHHLAYAFWTVRKRQFHKYNILHRHELATPFWHTLMACHRTQYSIWSSANSGGSIIESRCDKHVPWKLQPPVRSGGVWSKRMFCKEAPVKSDQQWGVFISSSWHAKWSNSHWRRIADLFRKNILGLLRTPIGHAAVNLPEK